ncbi:MAG: hypothetical protein KJN84_03605 [Bacteroidia bacterium]|nr:hypothetical protein [Bacteroidia bacterium]
MKILISNILILLLVSCNDTRVPLPKPRIYPKVNYPSGKDLVFSKSQCPFEMTVPTYFKYIKDEKKNKGEAQYSCWFDLVCEELNTNVHFSYVPITTSKNLEVLTEDAFEMVDRHNVKASYRDEIKISNSANNVYGFLFQIDGPVASPTQFFLTDSTQHFVRGSLYFNDVVNRDSIAPVFAFLKKDLDIMLDTWVWK